MGARSKRVRQAYKPVRSLARWSTAAPLVTSASSTPSDFRRIDRVMRAREHEHLFFAKGSEAVGEPDREISRQHPMPIRRKCGTIRPGPSWRRASASFNRQAGSAVDQNRRAKVEGQRLRPAAATVARIRRGKFRRNGVPSDFRASRANRIVSSMSISIARAALSSSYGHFACGGIDEKIEFDIAAGLQSEDRAAS